MKLMHFRTTDMTCSYFKHFLHSACWCIMQRRTTAGSASSSSNFLCTSATSQFFLPVIDGAPSVVMPTSLLHGKPAHSIAEVRGVQRSHQTPLTLTLRKYNEGLLFSVLWYCSLFVRVQMTLLYS